MFESVWIAMLCGTLYGGEPEVVAYFDHGVERSVEQGGDHGADHSSNHSRTRSYVRVDCVTPTLVIEFGRDTSSGLRDSLTQAVFNADILGREALVLIIDSDGHIGSQEFQVLRAGELLGVRVERISAEIALHNQYQRLRDGPAAPQAGS